MTKPSEQDVIMPDLVIRGPEGTEFARVKVDTLHQGSVDKQVERLAMQYPLLTIDTSEVDARREANHAEIAAIKKSMGF